MPPVTRDNAFFKCWVGALILTCSATGFLWLHCSGEAVLALFSFFHPADLPLLFPLRQDRAIGKVFVGKKGLPAKGGRPTGEALGCAGHADTMQVSVMSWLAVFGWVSAF